MQLIDFKYKVSLTLLAVFFGACAPLSPVVQPDQPQAQGQPQPQPQVEPAEPPMAEAPAVPKIDPMADVPGDKLLPVLQGAMERIDCVSGVEDLHARIAFEARGGKVANFAYYSKWKPRTCAFDFSRTSPGTKWRLTPDGSTRVHTPQGRFLIRTQANAYIFEFEQVQRNRYCGMPGEINGTMTIKRGTGKPDCSVAGIMDTNDSYLDALYKKK
jgi:hypothetical protein